MFRNFFEFFNIKIEIWLLNNYLGIFKNEVICLLFLQNWIYVFGIYFKVLLYLIFKISI